MGAGRVGRADARRREGVNLHARVTAINDPFYFTRQGLQTHPLLYGLILFKRMLGADARLVPVRLRSSRAVHLKVWAVREATNTLSTLNVLLINKGPRSALIHLNYPRAARPPSSACGHPRRRQHRT